MGKHRQLHGPGTTRKSGQSDVLGFCSSLFFLAGRDGTVAFKVRTRLFVQNRGVSWERAMSAGCSRLAV